MTQRNTWLFGICALSALAVLLAPGVSRAGALCRYTSGPLAGQERPVMGLPTGARCSDGAGSFGYVVQTRPFTHWRGAPPARTYHTPPMYIGSGAPPPESAAGEHRRMETRSYEERGSEPVVGVIQPEPPGGPSYVRAGHVSEGPPPPPPPPPPEGWAPPPHPTPAPQLTPVRAFIRAFQIAPPGVGAYGVVSFRARATPETRARLINVCQAFAASLPTQASVAGLTPLADQMLTFWPLDNPDSPQARADNCDYAVDHYELIGGLKAIMDARRQHARLDGPGPFLLGWSPSSARGVPDQLVLVVDMSDLKSLDSFNRAFQFWQQKVVENPAMWRNGFRAEAFKLAFRDFCDEYGKDILSGLKVSVGK